MPSKLPSFMRFHQCLNAIATTFLRRAFAGAIRAQRHFRRSPHTILRAPAAPSATQDRASNALAGAPFARPNSMEAEATVAILPRS
jgi:hypothetical protein